MSQTLISEIRGAVSNKEAYKYAYLERLSDKNIYHTPVLDGKFQFCMERLSDFELAALYLSKDSIDFSNSARFIDVNNSRFIVIEDVSIDVGFFVKSAKVSGGEYNNQLTEMLDVQNGITPKDFFTKYPDSPVSLYYLSILNKISRGNYILRSIIPVKSGFELLTPRLRNTPEGKKLWEEINN